MNWLDEVNKPRKPAPIRALIYGIEGVGKSTFGADAPSAIFISTEGGTSRIKGAKEMPRIKTWDDVMDAVSKLTKDKHPFKTLVIDSADWVEKIAHAKIIGESNKDIIRVNGGYGAGYRESEKMHKELIDALTELYQTRDMNVIVTAHYHVKTAKDPEAIQDYDTFQIKCHEFVSSLWREWCETILFARFETLVKADKDADKGRALGTGRRLMYTQQRPAFAAKNRFNLPFEMEVSWSEFEAKVKEFEEGMNPYTLESVTSELEACLKLISDETLVKRINVAINNACGDVDKLVKILQHAKATLPAPGAKQ